MTNALYNRYVKSNNYDRHLFRPDRTLQSAELNEVQSNVFERIGDIGNVLFKDGSIIRGCDCVVDADSGAVSLASGSLYLAGAVRGIAPGNFTVATTGSVIIGVYLQETVIDEIDDPALLNPAVGTRAYMEPGAARLQVTPVWGHAGDDKDGPFYPVYEVLNGILKVKEAPPSIDAVNAAIQAYDRTSTGGSYVVSGLDVRRGADLADDVQTYSITAGQARANGRSVILRAAIRHVFEATPDLRAIEQEPHVSTGTAAQRVNFDYAPIAAIDEVSITAQKAVTLVHGAVAGGMDPLPDTAILKIVSVNQGATAYTKDVDYKLTAGKVDWSFAGAEPAPGSSYDVTYQHITVIEPTEVDDTGFTVTGAVAESLIQVSYRYKVPRIDRLAINESGDVVVIRGVASDWMPVPPSVPGDLLLLATVHQAWAKTTTITQDSPRMVPMGELAYFQKQLDSLKLLIATQSLHADAAGREAVLKKDVFADPLMDDSMRDAGVFQTGAIVAGTLCLPIQQKAAYFDNDIEGIATLPHNIVPLVEQNRASGSMAVNPYQAFSPIPAQVTLDPAVDQMTYTTDTWASSITNRMTVRLARGSAAGAVSDETIETVSSTTASDQICRPQTIHFTIKGFAAGETLHSVSFDGIATAPGSMTDMAALPVADANGVVTGRFNVPVNVPAGRKTVQFVGAGGSYGSAYYTSASWSEDRVLRRAVTEYVYEYDRPPPREDPPYVPPVIVNDPDPTPVPEPIMEKEPTWVENFYVQYIGREGEPEGVAYWQARVDAGESLSGIAGDMIASAIYNQAPSVTSEGINLWYDVQNARAACITDPLAQTFVTPAAAHIVGVDLWFVQVGNTDAVVQLRTVSNGLPTRNILAEARLAPGAIPVNGNATRALFAAPYFAQAGEELAFVVLSNDAETALAIAELGKWDGSAWITAQPYTIGVLLSSSNNNTWTAHQDRDLRFRVLAADYTQTARVIDLGSIAVTAATDLMVMGLEQKPGRHSAISYAITLPDGTTISAASNQPIALNAPVTGNVALKATLRGDSTAGPVLHRGGQLLVGWLGSNSDYVGRALKAGPASRIRVVVDALLPSGSTLEVRLKGADVGDVWSAPIAQIADVETDNGFHELTFEASDITEAMVQPKVNVTGSPAARPLVRNIRMAVM
jgi:hypothetical protein